jgi:hypothetical protein
MSNVCKPASVRRIGLVAAAALLGLLALLGTANAKWSVVQSGNLTLKVDGGVSPSVLPQHEFAPATFTAKGRIATVDGSHPPALREAVLYLDRGFAADVYGLPTCRAGQLEARTTKEAKQTCPTAIVGSGTGTAEIVFPEQAPILTSSPLTLFNGGEKGGLRTVYVHAYTTVPTPTAIIATFKFRSVEAGRFGVRADVKLPKIAGGSGSLTAFDIKVKRSYRYRGFRKSFSLAQCRDGRLDVKSTVFFKDEVGDGGDSTLSVGVTLPCTPKKG